jgi:hypothetical protein
MTSTEHKKIVACPCCKGESIYAPSNSFRPFCSARCKNMDLGAWASESFRLAAEPPVDEGEQGESRLQ